MILLPVVAVIAISESKPARQLAAQIATVMLIACLLITYARSAWIGAAAGVATLAVLAIVVMVRRAKGSPRKNNALFPIALIAVAAGFFLLIWPETSSLVGRATSLSNVSEQHGWTYREQMWRGALNMIREKPLTGYGIGLYPYYQWKYSGSGTPLSLARTSARPDLGEEAHNLYGQTAAELGIPGLLLLIAAPLTFLVMGVIRLRGMDAGLRRGLLIGTMAATVAFIVDAFGSPAWQCAQVSMFYWLVLGLGVSCLRTYAKSTEPAPQDAPRLGQRRALALAACALSVLLPTAAIAAAPESTTSCAALLRRRVRQFAVDSRKRTTSLSYSATATTMGINCQWT